MTTINYVPYEEKRGMVTISFSSKGANCDGVSRSLVAAHANRRHINCLNNPPLRLNERVRQGISAARGGLFVCHLHAEDNVRIRRGCFALLFPLYASFFYFSSHLFLDILFRFYWAPYIFQMELRGPLHSYVIFFNLVTCNRSQGCTFVFHGSLQSHPRPLVERRAHTEKNGRMRKMRLMTPAIMYSAVHVSSFMHIHNLSKFRVSFFASSQPCAARNFPIEYIFISTRNFSLIRKIMYII